MPAAAPSPVDATSSHLAANLRSLREARGLTQVQIARMAGVPRATWAHLESGAGNPTLAVLVKVATALQLRVEELIGPPKAVARLYRARELTTRNRGACGIRRLLPDPIAGMEIERMELPPRGGMAGVPHTPGTREYLTCERGQIELAAAGEVWALGPGDVLVFRGDQKHGYRNPTGEPAVAYSVVCFSPAP
ncbi:MAG: helix-turn-helix transcriptional regulator [Kofleriaceae bacterium]|nr:helix-turn-helix transcriptional regulator [Myxococcales bacterium]MCB9559715.1 helix-turn-helix transcriptional regulator [Kofleriaceae bacterium]MCB9573976.1 helix-turn-helix transcriptional regulator [Kofleriaceae bacterium]